MKFEYHYRKLEKKTKMWKYMEEGRRIEENLIKRGKTRRGEKE